MEVILLKDVKNVGKKDQIVNVSDGYAANFLFPRGLAVKKTSKGMEVLGNQQEETKKQDEQNRANAIAMKEKIESVVLEFVAGASKDGRMFGTISPKQIEQEYKNKYGIVIDKRKFVDKYPVNAFGFTTLKVELYKGVIAACRIHVSDKNAK